MKMVKLFHDRTRRKRLLNARNWACLRAALAVVATAAAVVEDATAAVDIARVVRARARARVAARWSSRCACRT
jgi:uncharacterized protein with PhoU and TrkA domain